MHDHYTPSRRRSLVDVICTHAGANDGAQAAISLENCLRDLDATATDRTIGLVEGLAQLIALQTRPHLKFDPLRLRQKIEPLLGQFVENDDEERFSHAGRGARRAKEFIFSPFYSARRSRNSTIKSRSACTPSIGIAL